LDEQQARKLLGIDDGPVSPPDLRQARNNALKAHHPDKVGSDPAAVRRSTYWAAQINAAYQLLEVRADSREPLDQSSADRDEAERYSFAAAARRAQERAAAHERADAGGEERSSARSDGSAPRDQAQAHRWIASRRSLIVLAGAALVVAATWWYSAGGLSGDPRTGLPPVAAQSTQTSPATPTRTPPEEARGTQALAPACPKSAPTHAAAGSTATATIETPKGPIVVRLEADLGPAAVGNFIALAGCGYYNGVVFHRLVPGFVVQGGDGAYGRSPNVDPAKVGTGGPGYTIDDDPVTAQYGRGVFAMARTTKPHSEGSQFFIVLDDAARPSLADANTYAIMGHVTSGMDVVDAIAAMPNSGQPTNTAIDPVQMTSVTIATP